MADRHAGRPRTNRLTPPPGSRACDYVAISGAMSANEILQRYPSTEPVFQELHINRLREGYESVDELAWRHGMDVSQLIDTLQRVILSYPHN